MSQENVELMHRAMQAFNARDVETFLTYCAPDIEWQTELIGTPAYRGRDGIRRMFRDIEIAWKTLQGELEEIRAVGELVLVSVRYEARGATSGASVEGHFFWVVEMHDGKGQRVRAFTGRTEALETVGLSD
jgi:ketosteroid isomerase-like protein